MTLNDLKNVINFTFDLEDDEVCGRFYIELDEINEKYLGIEVVRIDRDSITCKLTDFLRRLAIFHGNEITDYLNDNYYDGEQKDYLLKQLTKRKISSTNQGDITDDGGEAVSHFIESDMYYFLTQK